MGLGVYIHFPFCVSKCDYCDFASYGKDKWPCSFDDYVDLVIKEWNILIKNGLTSTDFSKMSEANNESKLYVIGANKSLKNSLLSKGVSSVYFGGGTPSLLSGSQIKRLVDVIRPYFSNTPEISLECNPGTVTYEKLVEFRSAGINRLSIGVQAAQDKILKRLGRIHKFDDFKETVNSAKEAGFENISADIMFGLPDQSLSDWKETVLQIIKAGVQHVSAYGLKVEEDTAFDRYVMDGTLVLPEADLEREMYHKACVIMNEEGFVQYEISNFSKSGFECRHNLNYWESGDYVGLGVSSHSKLENLRYWNKADFLGYKYEMNEDNKEGRLPIEGFEILDLKERVFERIILSLRLNKGLNIEEFKEEFGEGEYRNIENVIEKNIEAGLLEITANQIKFTDLGRDLSNQVYLDLIA